MDIKKYAGLGFRTEGSSAHVKIMCATTLPPTSLIQLCRLSPHWRCVQMRSWSVTSCLASKSISQQVDWYVVTKNKQHFLICSHCLAKYIHAGCSCEQFYAPKCECLSAVHSRQNSLSTHCFLIVITLSNKSLFR